MIFLIINIEKLKQENKNSVDYDIEIMPEELEIKDIKVLKPVKVEFSLKIYGEEVIVKGNYKTEVEYQCVRCLENFKTDFKGKFETLFYNEENIEDEETEESYGEGDVFREPIENGKINIVEFVRENMLVEMEQYPICSEDCSGVENFQEYDNKGIDPRWHQLKNFIKDNK